MDGLLVMQGDIENQGLAMSRPGKISGHRGLGPQADRAPVKQGQPGAIRRKALGDITNSRSNANKDKDDGVKERAAVKTQTKTAEAQAAPPVFPEEVESTSYRDDEENFVDPVLESGMENLLRGRGDLEVRGSRLSLPTFTNMQLPAFEQEPETFAEHDADGILGMLLDEDGDGLSGGGCLDLDIPEFGVAE